MKCLSLWQPWATLIAIGAKEYETRHWHTSHRGPILIHAAKRPIDRETRLDMAEAGALKTALSSVSEFPLGAIVAYATLANCIKTDSHDPADTEYLLGDWSPGRFAWRMSGVNALPTPIPMRGQQGLFDVSREIEERVEQMLRSRATCGSKKGGAK